MSNQAPLNGSTNVRSPNANGSPAKAVFGNAADVMHDVTELAELQAKLLATDVNTMKRRVTIPIVLLVVAVSVLLGLIPVALLGVAELFVVYAELSRVGALFAAAGCGAGVTLVLAIIAWIKLKSSFTALENSRQELQRNIAWIKTTLKSGGKRPMASTSVPTGTHSN